MSSSDQVDWVYVDELAFELTPELPGVAEFFVHEDIRDIITAEVRDEVSR